jgi:hypothetical protein
MDIKYRYNGNLALKPQRQQPRLSLVQSENIHSTSAFQEVIDQTFAYLFRPACSPKVQSVLEGASSSQLFPSVKERRIVFVAGSIATFALFFFSFFSF